jgi:ATP-dependent RNA helicase DHX8/PRP22
MSIYEKEFLEATVPEIQRSSLAGSVLYLKSLNLPDINILKFDFLDPPSRESLEDALRQLYLIDAIDENGHITDVGRIMAGISNLSASIEIQSLLKLFINRLVFF